jgi:hypothetical protein
MTSLFRHRVRTAIVTSGVTSTLLFASMLGSSASAMDTGNTKDSVENYLGISSNGLSRLQRRQEEALAVCMKKEGFDYFPESANIPSDALDGGTSNRKAFVDKYGYGVSTLITPPKKGTKSKNQAYVEKLSVSDKRAYYIALLGQEPDKAGSNANAALNPKSCIGKVTSQLFGDISKLQGLITKYQDIQKRIDSNPKVVRAMRDWSACMKKGGYTYTKDTSVPEEFSTKLGKLYSSPPSILGTADSSSIDVAGLESLKKLELSTSKVDWDCSKQHLGVRDQIASELQKKFIDENKAALNDFKKVLDGK